MNKDELKVIKQLDDGSLYADRLLIEELFRYPDMRQPRLLLAYNKQGKPSGYLPIGHYYQATDKGEISTYIAAMPNSPAISATYPPGAEHILKTISSPYFDSDMIADFSFSQQHPTASITCLPFNRYSAFLSPSRQKDLRRKLKKAEKFTIQHGNLEDIRNAWQWMEGIWDERDGRFGSTPYNEYLETTLSWLTVLEKSLRTHLKIDKYMLDGKMVGINCCAIHRYNNRNHCDDYLTWYNPLLASGLGIVSIINNIKNPALAGFRYNLSNPGINGVIQAGHQYKWDVIPEPLRLTQSVISIR
ncbi:MAG: hypothetical protein DSZ29_06095 [Aquificaceae bacterium]|nr:MAG: hypothetical protein DSZ29_06095 [Aquificaceae bacterium]